MILVRKCILRSSVKKVRKTGYLYFDYESNFIPGEDMKQTKQVL